MTQHFANIIINISHEDLDKSFQYKIPARLDGVLRTGDIVQVPFGKGNRVIKGYVINITSIPEYDPDKQKEIIGISTDASLVEDKLIKLAAWMKDTYGSTMITALKTVLPIKKKIKAVEQLSVRLLLDIESAKSQLYEYERKHQTARYRLLKELISEQVIDQKIVTQKLNISMSTIRAMQELSVITVDSKRVYRNSVKESGNRHVITLNDEQKVIADQIKTDLDNGKNDKYLIHGITGSGKTEVYIDVIEKVIESGRQVIVLIPEIALTYQTVMRFIRRFGDRVSTLHSKLSDGEKYDQFERAKNGDIDIMIGPRSALFTPFSNIGLIVIDEEHESSYKSDSMPKYHAREVAQKLCEMHKASLLLGSATPSIETYYRAKQGEIRLFSLNKRANDAKLSTVDVVDMREELKALNKSIFSKRLRELIEDRLNKNEQTMLFLNRRGYSGFVTCRSCGHVMKCPHCDVSLSRHGKDTLVCHYCGYTSGLVSTCPKCSSTMIGEMKAGTEKIEEMIKKAFPQAEVLRMDADTTREKDGHEKILSAFANREADILVGTQMIVKGHDFPYVTLVGILAADMSLYANDYRASERTFQLLTQASGRAGRGERNGQVVIQTYNPEHYSIVCSAGQNYEQFYKEEMSFRSLLNYPPVFHMLAILAESMSEILLSEYCDNLASFIKDDIIDANVFLIGPADASVKKISDVYRRVIYLKSQYAGMLENIKDAVEDFENEHKDKRIRISFDFDPMNGY